MQDTTITGNTKCETCGAYECEYHSNPAGAREYKGQNNMSTTVSNLTSLRSGAPVKNQFIINVDGVETFQSYQTAIARKYKYGTRYAISSDYNYSVTTSRYFNQWLKSNGWSDLDIKELKKWLVNAKDGDRIEDIAGFASVHYFDSL